MRTTLFFPKIIRNIRKLILPSLDWTRPKDPPLSLGHASILANLKKHNIPVIACSWAVNDPKFEYRKTRDFILEHATENTDVALGAFVWNEKAIQLILSDLKKNNFPGRVIIGGPQVSYVKKGIEKFYPQADIFVRGYAEEALVHIMQNFSSNITTKGVHYAGGMDVGLTATADLENLPSPYLSGIIKPQPFIRWETQRGCPFRCAFCQHRESDDTMKRRSYSLSRIQQEVDFFSQHTIIQDIAVLDPIFNSGSNYLAILDRFIQGNYTGKLALQCRVEMVKTEFLEKIEQLNKTARVVLEFGLQTIIAEEQRIIDRPNNIKKVETILQEVINRKIECEVSLIFGLPNQTVATFKESIDFCKRLQVPIIHAFPLMLLRGTPLYDNKIKLGLIESCEIASTEIDRVQDGIPHVVSSPSFSFDEWKKMASMAEELNKYNDDKVKKARTRFSPIDGSGR